MRVGFDEKLRPISNIAQYELWFKFTDKLLSVFLGLYAQSRKQDNTQTAALRV